MLEQQVQHAAVPAVSQRGAGRTAARIIRLFSSRVIGTKARQRQPEARAAADSLEVREQAAGNPGQASGVRRQVTRRSHRPGHRPQAVLRHQAAVAAAAAAEAVKAADQADPVNDIKLNKME